MECEQVPPPSEIIVKHKYSLFTQIYSSILYIKSTLKFLCLRYIFMNVRSSNPFSNMTFLLSTCINRFDIFLSLLIATKPKGYRKWFMDANEIKTRMRMSTTAYR